MFSEFSQPFLLVLLAEISDKSQLVALAFAARFGARATVAGILAATLLVNLVSVSVGALLGVALPSAWIGLAAGLAFIGFGLWTLRGDGKDEETEAGRGLAAKGVGVAVLSIAATFFLAELGDKTMLATVAVASQQRAFVPVWLGASLGMLTADLLAVLVGSVAGRRLPERPLRLAAAGIFVLTGVVTLLAVVLQ
jgi:putative Ca2+/H+ antiporter (TMEM165/GDT1 family)